MSQFKLFKRSSCPICNGIRKDCRENTHTQIIHCRADVISAPGYRFIKQDAWGFNMWKAESGQDSWNESEWVAHRQRIAAEREKRLLEEAKHYASLLDADERDRNIRQLHRQLGLSTKHRRQLRDRGLSDAQIDSGKFFSIEPWQEVSAINPRLAGVNLWGTRLIVNAPGIGCPVWDAFGRIIGFQIRFDDATENKYKWATSRTKKRPNGATSHLQNGELPISCCRPIELQAGGAGEVGGAGGAGEAQNSIGLAEGFIKSYIAAQKLNCVVIGAAGGNFPASPQQLKQIFEEIGAQPNTHTVNLYPDAGVITNPTIMQRYQLTAELVQQWGYEIRVAWWGQLTKQEPDIDELENLEALTYLSWDEFLALADWKPVHRPCWDEPDDAEYAAYVQQLEEQERVATAIEIETFSQWFTKNLSKWFKKSSQAASKLAEKLSISTTPKPPQPAPPVIHYEPGQLPTPAEYEALLCPRIQFQDGQRLQVCQEAVEKGWKHVLDKSAPGQGKSHTAGITQPDAIGVEKLWYFNTTHRNPTTSIIEQNYRDLPVRHNGLKRDPTHKTPLGHDWIVWPQTGEQPDIPGNCHRTQLFTLLREKNIRGVESAETSPICKTCHLKDACKSHVGNGFGFRDLRREALTSPRLRAHPDSAPSPIEYPYLESGFFWDEAATLIQSMESVTAELADFEQQWGELESVLPDLHEALTPLRVELRSLFRGEVNIPRYGFDDAAVRSFLPPPPDNLQGIIAEIENQLRPDFSQLKEPDNVDSAQLRGVSWATRQVIRAGLRRESYQDAASQFQALCLNWLVPFLKVWGGQPGALRFDRGQLTIFSRSTRHRDLAAATRFNLYLDATAQPEYLALSVGINPNQMLVIEQEPPNYSNLRIVQVSGMGLLGKDRSGSMQERVLELKHELSNRHPGIKFIDWKNQAFEGEGHWFVDSRGVNDFQGVPALASFGIPFQNLGHQQALYQTLTGRYVSLDKHHPDPEFQRFLDTRVQAEIIQMAGRLRTHLRPTEQLTYYFVGDYDLTFLRQAMPGVVIESVEAVNITPLAGDAHQQNWWKIITAISKLREQQQKVTQTAVAKLSGVVQSTISWLAAGSWKKIIEIATSSLNSSFDKILRQLDEQGRFTAAELAEQVLTLWADLPPEELLTELRTVEKVYGKRIFYAALALAPPPVQANLLAAVLGVLPPEWQREIEAITFGDTPLGSVALQGTFTPL